MPLLKHLCNDGLKTLKVVELRSILAPWEKSVKPGWMIQDKEPPKEVVSDYQLLIVLIVLQTLY